MKDPLRGTFRITDWYDAHPHESISHPRLIGVVTAPGIPAAAGIATPGTGLQVRIDPANPSRLVIDTTGQH